MEWKRKKITVNIPGMQSIKAKLRFLVIFAVVITAVVNLCIVIPSAKKSVVEVSQHYLYDSAQNYGRIIDAACVLGDPQELLQAESLRDMIGDARIQGVENSYAYVVAFDGTMLYHPTAEKIGKPVENESIRKVVSELSEGKALESDVTSYWYAGNDLYAGYYIGTEADFILVVSADKDDVLSPVWKMSAVAVCGVAVSIALCLILSMLVINRVVNPIVEITGVVERMATLDFSLDAKQVELNARKDETGNMSRAITHLREEMGNIVYDLQQQSEHLYNTSSSLSSNTDETQRTMNQVEQAALDISEGATSQANETEEATGNVVTIGNMVEATNEQVTQIQGIVVEMQKQGDEAAEKIRELNEQNEKTKESIQMIYNQTNVTNQSAEKIREATALIASIAEETSLLSLNASIEAARAGEQGRGFAVVAAQIQKLAEQSNASTEKIEEIVTLLMEDSETAVKTMEEVKDIMEKQVVAVEKAGAIFSRVQNGIRNTKQGVDKIARHTNQMDEARIKVVDVVQSLTAIAEENAASTEQTSASVTQVSGIIENIASDAVQIKDVAEKLKSDVNKFKLFS